MIYAVGMSLSAANEWSRLAVVAGAFLVTLAVAYSKFAVRRTPTAEPPAAVPDTGAASDTLLVARIDALEHTLAGVREALGS